MDKIAKKTAAYWLVAAFVLGFFAVGVPYWQIPYAKVSLPDTLYGAGLLVVGVLAAAARGFGKSRVLSSDSCCGCFRARCGTRTDRC